MITVEGRLVLDEADEACVAALTATHARLVRELWRRCVRGSEIFEKAGHSTTVLREMQQRGWSTHQARSAYHAAVDAQHTAEKTAAWAVKNLGRQLQVAEERLNKALRSSEPKQVERRHGLACRRDRLASRRDKLAARSTAGAVAPSWGGRCRPSCGISPAAGPGWRCG